MKLIDKSALVAEIERRITSLENIGSENYLHDNYPERYAMLVTSKSLKFSIDTLEVKEVDLENEYEEFVVDDPIFGNFITNDTMGMELAKHFFELGLKVQKGEDSVNDGLKETQKNIWRSLDEKPSFPVSDDELLCSILVLYNNGNMFLYRYGKNGIPNDLLTPHFRNIMNAKWCYCKDVINK